MRLKHSSRDRWGLRHLVSAAITASLTVSFVSVRAVEASDTDLTSAQVAAEILRVQADADAVARRWADAELQSEALAVEIQAANEAVSASSVEYERLQGRMAQVAIDRFTGRANETILILGGNPVEAMERDALRAVALDVGAADLDTVAAVQNDLAQNQAHLDELNVENERLVDVLAESQTSINDRLAELAQLETHLKEEEVKREYEAQLAAQQREAERVAAAEAAALAAQQQAQAQAEAQAQAQAAVPARGGGSSSLAPTLPASAEPVAAPAAAATAPFVSNGSWVCPVAGLTAFGDTWGAPRPGGRKHQGVDMMSPSGTPLVAVVAGYVKLSTSERGGNLASLTGDDGNRYFYGHLSAWEGPSRQVAAGEVIGYVGKTGQTDANHLHFEIHPNGGAAVNPYSTVRQAC